MSNLLNCANDASPDEFVQAVAHPQRQEDAAWLLAMFRRITKLPAVMWGDAMIGFGEYNYTLANGKQDRFFRCGFSPRKQNLSLYVMAAKSEHPELFEKLGKHKTSKACLYINKLADVDLDILEQIVAADIEVMNQRYPVLQ